jgi:uncharacterized protein
MSIKETKDGTIIAIFVKPNAPKFKIESNDGEIRVNATQEPVRGKVNKEILKEFSKLLRVKVELSSGATSRQKTLFAKGITKNQAEQLLHKIES